MKQGPSSRRPSACCSKVLLGLALTCCWLGFSSAGHAASRRQSAEEWLLVTETNAPLPQVGVHDDEIRFYFPTAPRPVGFAAKLGRQRLPTQGYQVSSALLRLKRKPPPIQLGTDGWREPV